MILTINYINDDFLPYICNNFFGSRILSFQFEENDSNRLIFQSVQKNLIIILFPRLNRFHCSYICPKRFAGELLCNISSAFSSSSKSLSSAKV